MREASAPPPSRHDAEGLEEVLRAEVAQRGDYGRVSGQSRPVPQADGEGRLLPLQSHLGAGGALGGPGSAGGWGGMRPGRERVWGRPSVGAAPGAAGPGRGETVCSAAFFFVLTERCFSAVFVPNSSHGGEESLRLVYEAKPA